MKNQLTCGHNHRIKGRGYTDAELEACPILKAMVKAERKERVGSRLYWAKNSRY